MELKLIFHIIGAAQFFYGCYYDCTYVNVPKSIGTVTPYAGKLKYLTFLNAMLQTLYFTLAACNDLFGSNDARPSLKPLIRQFKDIIFSSLALPLSMFVATTFWGLYAVDRELILPRKLDPYFPGWLNHIMHTNIVIFALLELVSSFRMFPTKRKGMAILSSFMVCYLIWIHVIYYQTGSWVYPILNLLNWPLRVVFYLFSLGVIFTLYSVGERLNSAVWSKEVEQVVKSAKKKAK